MSHSRRRVTLEFCLLHERKCVCAVHGVVWCGVKVSVVLFVVSWIYVPVLLVLCLMCQELWAQLVIMKHRLLASV